MLPTHVALLSGTEQVDISALTEVAAAIQIQVSRDFGPLWGVNATVAAFPSLDAVPLGYWPVAVLDQIDEPGAAGYHWDDHNQPYALVEVNDTWPLTVSHETLEMLGDPSGNRAQAGPSPADNVTQVQFLVEVCDPCEDATYAYSINGVLVADFITPRFYDSVAAAGAQYSFTGAITAPRTILRGGYVSYLNPEDGHMYQQVWPENDAHPSIRDLSAPSQSTSLRRWADANPFNTQLYRGADPGLAPVRHAGERRQASVGGKAARAERLDALFRDTTRER